MARAWIVLVSLAAITGMEGCTGFRAHFSAAPLQLRILTFNIHHGEGADGKLDLERIASVIRQVKPDLIALQEVDDRAQRSGQIDQATELGRLTRMNHVFGKAMDYQGGAYGQAILSRWPIQQHSVHQLPQKAGREPRIALVATIRPKANVEVRFSSTHLDHALEEIRRAQVEEINRIFGDGVPAILGGDFNATPESQSMEAIFRFWQNASGTNVAPTFPAAGPRKIIDYILLRPVGQWKIVEARVLPEAAASDHRPVFAIVEFDPEK
jgi:endonuclease/exonuclease/phosphatase family metal-dependent hydrolase